MLRQALAVLCGFATMAVLGMVTRIGVQRFLFPQMAGMGADVPPAFLLANGAIGIFYAAVGGCVAAAVGKRYEAPTILGALLLGIAIGGVIMGQSDAPLWYAASAPVIAAIAATIAGYRWLGRDESTRRG